MRPTVLAVAASDPDGCAGIGADVRILFTLGCHPLTVLTAATVQNTKKFYSAEPISPKTIAKQIDAVYDDVRVDAVKIGLVGSADGAEAIARSLRKNKAKNIIVDPVIYVQAGEKKVVDDATIASIARNLIPISTVLTPNAAEARELTGIAVVDGASAKAAAKKIVGMGAKSVIVKGIVKGTRIIDIFYDGRAFRLFEKDKISTHGTHGGGCVFSSAIAAGLAKGRSVEEAVELAEKVIESSILHSFKIGKGMSAVAPMGDDGKREVLADLYEALALLESEPKVASLLPEVGMNLGYALEGAKSVDDVAAVSGRIRNADGRASSLGIVSFGASSHVARMILEMRKFDRSVRAAVNMAAHKPILSACRKMRMRIAYADRTSEPRRVAEKEGASLPWSVRETMGGAKGSIDAIHFSEAIGREESLVLFGSNPAALAKKVIRLAQKV